MVEKDSADPRGRCRCFSRIGATQAARGINGGRDKERGWFLHDNFHHFIRYVFYVDVSFHFLFYPQPRDGRDAFPPSITLPILHPARLLGRICLKPLLSIIHTVRRVIDGRGDH